MKKGRGKKEEGRRWGEGWRWGEEKERKSRGRMGNMVHLVPKPESFGLKFLNYNTESCILKQNIYKKKILIFCLKKEKKSWHIETLI